MSYVQDLIAAGDHLYSNRGSLLSMWQDVMRNFAPASADYTSTHTLGEDYAADLATSYPLLVARDLTDSFSSMLRPNGVAYSEMYVEGLKDHDSLSWLEWASGVQKRAKEHRPAMFDATMKECDRDFALLGNAVLSVETMPDKSSLLYRAWHLRDVVWSDDLGGLPECVHRKWVPTLAVLVRTFGLKKLHPTLQEKWRDPKNRYMEVRCRHVVVPADMYDGNVRFRTKLVSVFIDEDNCHEMEVTGQRRLKYVIPRWRRIKGVQYAISPAVECALPEARLLQAMVLTLLTAGEKAVDPPLLAVEGIIRSDLDTRAGAVIWRGQEYDEHMNGSALQPILSDKNGLPFGLEMANRSEMLLRMSMYLDKLELPIRGGAEMTAYEFSKRVEQYIRQVSHLFEPVEVEYTGGVEEATFAELMDNGAFGPVESIPEELSEADVRFRFRNPIRDAAESGKGEVFLESLGLVKAASEIDPSATLVMDIKPALRDAILGKRGPTSWLRTPEAIEAAEEEEDERMQAEQAMQLAQGASEVAGNMAKVE